MEIFKIAKNYGVNFFGVGIPRNAIYFKLKNKIYYISDFEQIYNKNALVRLYELKNKKFFKPIIIKVDTNDIFIKALTAFMENKNVSPKTTCSPVMYRKDIYSVAPKERKVSAYIQKPTSRMNNGVLTDYSLVPEWVLNK